MNIKMCMLFIRTEMIQGQKPQKNICPRIEKVNIIRKSSSRYIGWNLEQETRPAKNMYLCI